MRRLTAGTFRHAAQNTVLAQHPNNAGYLNRAAPEGRDLPDKLFVQQGRKVFKEVVPMVSALIIGHAEDSGD